MSAAVDVVRPMSAGRNGAGPLGTLACVSSDLFSGPFDWPLGRGLSENWPGGFAFFTGKRNPSARSDSDTIAAEAEKRFAEEVETRFP